MVKRGLEHLIQLCVLAKERQYRNVKQRFILTALICAESLQSMLQADEARLHLAHIARIISQGY